MKILAVIPARGGSKGIPHKNIFPINRRPLMTYSIEAILSSKIDCTLVVSTDDNIIKKVAKSYKSVIVIDRPSMLATDTASTESVLIHAVDYMNDNYNQKFDYVMTVQATSPLRTPETIKRFIEVFQIRSNEYDAQLTLTADYTDFWVKSEQGEYTRRSPSAPRRRQDREPLYAENGCLYITSVEALKKTNSVLGTHCAGYEIPFKEAIDINTIDDIKIVEAYL